MTARLVICFLIWGVCIFSSIGQSTTFGCMAWKNNFLTFTNHTNDNILTIHVYGFRREGWIGISFQNTKNMSDFPSLMIVSSINEAVWSIPSHLSDPSQNVTFEIDNSAFYSLDNLFHFSVNISNPPDSLVDAKYVAFARSFVSGGENASYLPVHTEVDFRLSSLNNPDVTLNGWCDTMYFGHAGRMFADQIWLFVPILAFHFLIMVLLIYFREDQPIRSRGIGTFMATTSVCINLVISFVEIQVLTYEQMYSYSCFISVFGQYVTVLISVTVPIMHLLRYVALNNIQYHKRKVVSNKIGLEVKSKLPLRVLLLMRLTHPLILISVIGVLLTVYWGIAIILFSSYNWKCGTPVESIVRYYCLGMVVVSAFIIVGAGLFDIWQDRLILLKCKLRRFYIENDHFYFRSEIVVVIPGILVCFLWIFVPTSNIIHICLCEAIFWFVIWVSGGWTLIITIFQNIRSYFVNPPVQKGKLEEILRDVAIYDQFIDFCEKEYSLENIYCLNAMKEYNTASAERKIILAREIFENFLKPSSPFEVNVSSRVAIDIERRINENKCDNHLFEQCYVDVMKNLTDTFSRFVATAFYISYIEKIRTMNSTSSLTFKHTITQ